VKWKELQALVQRRDTWLVVFDHVTTC